MITFGATSFLAEEAERFKKKQVEKFEKAKARLARLARLAKETAAAIIQERKQADARRKEKRRLRGGLRRATRIQKV